MKKLILAIIFLLGIFLLGCTQNTGTIVTEASLPTASPTAATANPPSITPTPESTATPTSVAESATPTSTDAPDNELKPIPAEAYRKVEFLEIGNAIQTDVGIAIRLNDIAAVPASVAFNDYAPDAEFFILDSRGKKIESAKLAPSSRLGTSDHTYQANGIFLKLLNTSVGLGEISHVTVIVGPLTAIQRLRITPVSGPTPG